MRGKRFGEKVHRVFEAYPPVTDPWPPPGAALPVIWDGEEKRRWNAIVGAVRSSPLCRELRSSRVVGTELALLRVRGGTADEERADLVARLPGPTGELRVIDYKTGERDRALEEGYFLQLREYRGILSEAWRVPVRAFLWYVESGASFEVTETPEPGRSENFHRSGTDIVHASLRCVSLICWSSRNVPVLGFMSGLQRTRFR